MTTPLQGHNQLDLVRSIGVFRVTLLTGVDKIKEHFCILALGLQPRAKLDKKTFYTLVPSYFHTPRWMILRIGRMPPHNMVPSTHLLYQTINDTECWCVCITHSYTGSPASFCKTFCVPTLIIEAAFSIKEASQPSYFCVTNLCLLIVQSSPLSPKQCAKL